MGIFLSLSFPSSIIFAILLLEYYNIYVYTWTTTTTTTTESFFRDGVWSWYITIDLGKDIDRKTQGQDYSKGISKTIRIIFIVLLQLFIVEK